MNLREKVEILKELNEDNLQKFITSKYAELESRPVNPNEKHIRPALIPMIYRNYINSSFSDVQITGGIDGDIMTYNVDNTCEVFNLFVQKIKRGEISSVEEIFQCVSKTIFDYVGGEGVSGNILDRFRHLKDSEKNKLSAFNGSGHAWCVERSVMAHQIFKMLGLESELVISPIWLDKKIRKDGSMKTEMHAFNMVRYNDKTILFDSTLLDYSKPIEEQSSIVEILPQETFDNLSEIPERIFISKNNETRTCIYNPQNKQPSIIGEFVNENEDVLY